MDLSVGTVEGVEVKDLVRTLRKALGLTQEQLADRSEGKITRLEVNKIEAGANQASTAKIRDGLASGFGLTPEDLSDYFIGRIDAVETMRRVGRSRLKEPADDDPQFPNRGLACRIANELGFSQVAIDQVRSMSRLPDWSSGAHDLPAREWLRMVESAESMQSRGGSMGARPVVEVEKPPPGVPKVKRRR